MARNKYPEETVAKIIDSATQLFMKKGYENTSIQDIINHLNGLSKGAIYHHFRSKDDILQAVAEQVFKHNEELFIKISHDKTLNGAQKLEQLLESSVSNIPQQELFSLSVDIMHNPQLLAYQLKDTVEQNARHMIYPLLQEGMEDGSLPNIPYPLEFAETFLLLTNIWLNPMVFLETPEKVENKCRFLQQMIKGIGIEYELINETVISKLVAFTKLYQQKINIL